MKISLITPTYNSASTLCDTIKSVLAQSFTDYEYIIVDGKSSDGTVAIIKEMEPLFSGRLKWISESDRGLYDAINNGIRMSQGDVVGIINSDDFFHRDDILMSVAKSFENDDVDGIYGDVRFVAPDNLDKTIRYYSSRFFKPWKFRYGFMPAHPTFYTKKCFFDRYGYYKTDYKIAADFELLLRFIGIHNLHVRYVPLDFMKMRIGGLSTSGFSSTKLLNKEIKRACTENGVKTSYLSLYSRYIIKVWEMVFTRNK